ncbi:hypothetical protein J2Y69_001422 [Microbacterium resistens]|uniref:Uncharacterized protein n=1 Tax=Microbacterium resistens TaxID=156977 RepID=A0ABU1SC57_9MICO|nr:hypothetical protein [Microbacterium resistens]MDR6866823.1 hypothetical protein [Microbacterium resistens]
MVSIATTARQWRIVSEMLNPLSAAILCTVLLEIPKCSAIADELKATDVHERSIKRCISNPETEGFVIVGRVHSSTTACATWSINRRITLPPPAGPIGVGLTTSLRNAYVAPKTGE